MLSRKQPCREKERGNRAITAATPVVQFYWHRPLGAPPTTRRLTASSRRPGRPDSCCWALPLTLSQVIHEMKHLSDRSMNESSAPLPLETLELEGTGWPLLSDAEWQTLLQQGILRHPQRTHTRYHHYSTAPALHTIVFHGSSMTDRQRITLLQGLATHVRTVEFRGYQHQPEGGSSTRENGVDKDTTAAWDGTLHVVLQECPRVTALRFYHCQALTAAQTQAVRRRLLVGEHPQKYHYHHRNNLPWHALVLYRTPVAPHPVLLASAVEESVGLVDEFIVPQLSDEWTVYIQDITKLHRMRRYFRQFLAGAATGSHVTAEHAMGVVTTWYQATHRPQESTPDLAATTTDESSLDDARHSNSTGRTRVSTSSTSTNSPARTTTTAPANPC